MEVRKNSKVYYITIIRQNAGKIIESLKNITDKKGIHTICYDEAHSMLNYFGLTSGKKYKLNYLKEEADYSTKLLETFNAGKNIHNIF